MKICDPVQMLKKHHDIQLKCSMATPSLLHVESLATEYIKNFILSRIPNYFNTIYINEKHILDEYKRMDKTYNFISKPKPALAITPRINYEYNNDYHNDNRFGADIVINQSQLDTAFIKDHKRNIYMALGLEVTELEYNIKMMVDTKGKQVDLYKRILNTIPIGTTRQFKIDLDFHIPLYLMIQLANDVGFNIEDGNIYECTRFLSYLNSKSVLPIIYKYRRVNGINEFFVRMRDFRIRLDMTDRPSLDDGVVDNQTVDRFMIDFNIRVHIPGPKWYGYYSDHIHNKIIEYSQSYEESVMIGEITTHTIPLVNDRGWNNYLNVDYEEADSNASPEIDFTELFDSIRMTDIIRDMVNMNLCPNDFIEIKTYNSDEELKVNMDWTTFIGKYDKPFKGITTYLALYIDTEFINNQITIKEKLKENRIVDR